MMEKQAVVVECDNLNPDTKSDLGRIVLATAGRDAGRVFLVVGTEGSNYFFLCDGRTRRAEKPKRKKRRHLQFIGYADGETVSDIQTGKIRNRQVRRLLSDFGGGQTDGSDSTVSE